MRAAVMRSSNLVVDEISDPVPGPGQVLVRTIACGICGSDLHALKHLDQMVEMGRQQAGDAFNMDGSRDVVMGHEFSCEVLELGPGASGVEPGDIIVSIPILLGERGPVTIGYSNAYPGGYAERMVLQSGLPIKVPDGTDPRLAALTEPLAVGLHAVNRSAISTANAAVVLGCGPIGLACIAALKAKGIEPIVAADFSKKRRAVASTMGAHVVVDPRETPAMEAWSGAARSKSPIVFEAVGVPGMLQSAMGEAPRGTLIVVVGVCMEPDTIRPMVAITKELELRFCLGYTPAEFAGTLRSIADGEIDAAAMVTGTVDLDGVPGAFEALADPDEHVKILVEPS